MEVDAACAAAHTGQAGALFAHALGAVLAAHCAHADTLRWPPDSAQHIFNSGGGEYDFVVVGAGTAGSLVASRLAQAQGARRVLLAEAGDDPTFDSEVPAFLFSNQGTKQDWQHKTSTDNGHCVGSAGGSCKWAKGKGMGGSTSINAMLYVRGNKADYDEWESIGNPGWGYDDVLQYFKKTENYSLFDQDVSTKLYHSNAGELHLEKYGGPQIPWKNVIAEAWQELGYKYNDDINGESQIGISNVLGSVKNGMRYNLAKRLLHDGHKKGNLHVSKNTIATKIIIDPKTKITKAVLLKNNNGTEIKINVRKEVILSAGTIKSPQILMLSGIGPTKLLEDIKITPLLDLPVGKNLQDHPILPMFVQIPANMSFILSKDQVILFILQYMLSREGPFRGIGMTDLLGFVDTKNNSDVPDIEFHHIYFSKEDEVILPAYRSASGYVEEFWDKLGNFNKENDLVGIYPTLTQPKSRGELTLTSSDPFDNPKIFAGYFTNEDDIDTMIRGIDFVFKIANTTTFTNMGVKILNFDLKACRNFAVHSKDYWRCYIEYAASTIYHPVGTIKMAPVSESGVVDEELKVHGVSGLRVIDASVMPVIPRGNTMAPTLMVAEKGADIINKFWSTKEKSEL